MNNPVNPPCKDVVKATQFCLEYQRKFRRDVFLDLGWIHQSI